MQENEIYDVIARSLTDKSEASDKKILDTWLNSSETNRIIYEKLKDNWNKSNTRKHKVVGQEEVKERIWNKAAGQRKELPTNKPSFVNRQWYMKVAASIAVIVISLITVYYFLPKQSWDQATVSYIIKENSAGRKSTIYLNDGTVVHLNSESRIRYPEVFSDTARVVYLEGEGFFEVAKNAAKPFSVISHDVRTTALGTSFDVKAFDGSNDIEISLLEGKVRVSDESSSERHHHYDLSPGQSIAFNREKTQFTSVDFFDPKATLGWKDGVIYFKKANFATIKKELERWFGCEIVAEPAQYPPMSYTGEFHDQTLENILQSIGFVQNFNFEIQDKKVFIQFNHSDS